MALTATGRRVRKRRLKADINVVPYIDVMLVLLIIFMVTAPLMNLGVDIDLPQSNAKSIEEKKDPLVVSVDKSGAYFLAVKAGKNEAIDAADLEAKVGAIIRQNPKQAVFVAGDGDANYQKIMDVTVLLQRAGVEKVGLMSQPQPQGPR
jgi:biopolymer transport protein TolR